LGTEAQLLLQGGATFVATATFVAGEAIGKILVYTYFWKRFNFTTKVKFSLLPSASHDSGTKNGGLTVIVG